MYLATCQLTNCCKHLAVDLHTFFHIFFRVLTPKTSVGCSSGRQDSLNPPTLSAYSSNARAASGSAHFYGAQNQWEMSTMG